MRPGARRSSKDIVGGTVLRYRCIHPLDGTCPESTKDYVAQRRFRPGGVTTDSNVASVEQPRVNDPRSTDEDVEAENEIEVASLAESVRDIISILKGEDIPEANRDTSKGSVVRPGGTRWKRLSCITL